MTRGVPSKNESRTRDSLAAPRRPLSRAYGKLASVAGLALLATTLFASSALAAPAPVGLGTAGSFSVLGGETVTNTGPTTMFGDLGLSPGSSVTGAPVVLGQTHVDDAVAIGAKNSLTTAYNDAAGRPTNGSAGTELAGQTFTAGVRNASTSLLLSSGSVILNAQGDPNAVFIFQIGTTLTTLANTTVQLENGAQACNVFWQVGSSATLGAGTRFVGTIMAHDTITAETAATIHGRLLAQTAAVNLDTNTITQSNCAVEGTETSTPEETGALETAPKVGGTTTAPPASTPTVTSTAIPPLESRSTVSSRRAAAHRAALRRAAARRRARRAAARRHSPARPASPHRRGAFTG
jgi:hypothetical protein